MISPYLRDQRGASAVEFALVVPLFVALVLSVIHMSLVLSAAVNLHFATQETARCIAVAANNAAATTTDCLRAPNAAQVQAYGTARYVGPGISPQFVQGVSGTCTIANQICATGTYNMAMGFATVPITLSAKAYYPHA